MTGHPSLTRSRSGRVKVLRDIFVCFFFKTNLSGKKSMNFQRTLYNPLCSLLPTRPPRAYPVYGTVVLPVAPPTHSRLESLSYGRAKKRALESTEIAYQKERTPRQTGVWWPRAAIAILLYFQLFSFMNGFSYFILFILFYFIHFILFLFHFLFIFKVI